MREMGSASDVPIEPPEQTRLLNECVSLAGVIGGGVPGGTVPLSILSSYMRSDGLIGVFFFLPLSGDDGADDDGGGGGCSRRIRRHMAPRFRSQGLPGIRTPIDKGRRYMVDV